jgi:CheY-like chemotaxis protein
LLFGRAMEKSVVLVVEDDAETRAFLQLALCDGLGLAVAVARDGAEAIERARRHRPALVLLDMHLPAIDGYAVARQLKADPRTQDVWLVALTGRSERRQVAAAGCDEFLRKPIELDHLLVAIEAGLLRQRRRKISEFRLRSEETGTR